MQTTSRDGECMIVCNLDMNTFFYEHEDNDIVCFGAGNEFKDMLHNFSEFPWHRKIISLLDNDCDKWGKDVVADHFAYRIMSPSEFFQRENRNFVLLICSSYYKSILSQLENISSLNDCKCYIYEFMACKSLHENIPIKKDGAFLIPPMIHYCWFGKTEIPEHFKRCMESWRKFCPEYEIIEWNEHNCDIKENQFAFEAYQAGKFGFVPDYFRLKIVYEHGGIYLDTDVELLRNLDNLRREEAFCGLERPGIVAFGLGFAAQKKNPILFKMLQRYQDMEFSMDSNQQKKFVSPALQTKDLVALGMRPGNHWQKVGSMTIFPVEVLSPKHFISGETEITDYSYAVHHYAASWLSDNLKSDIQTKWRTAQEVLNRTSYPN